MKRENSGIGDANASSKDYSGQTSTQATQQHAVTLEGTLKKRGARMHRWSTRYVILAGPKLSYKIKRDSGTLRGSFDLVSGCILTEIQEESQMKGKKLYSFWLVWPQDKSADEEKAVGVREEEDSDDEFEHREEAQVGAVEATAAKVIDPNKPKDLKSVSFYN